MDEKHQRSAERGGFAAADRASIGPSPLSLNQFTYWIINILLPYGARLQLHPNPLKTTMKLLTFQQKFYSELIFANTEFITNFDYCRFLSIEKKMIAGRRSS